MVSPHRTCSIEGCERNHIARGWCAKHYRRWQKHGSPLPDIRPYYGHLTAEERFWKYTDRRRDYECWPWTAAVNAKGYGLYNRNSKSIFAHRFAYEFLVGPIPSGKVLDHACHNAAFEQGKCMGGRGCPHRRCVNPAHLDVVTPRQNSLRGNGPSANASRKTRCVWGHPFNTENTRYEKTGERRCLSCVRRRNSNRDRKSL